MGISGLYRWLDSIKRPEHIKKYSGLTLGIDTYGWLHKGAISCALELVQGTPTTRYVDYCMERIKMLRYHGVKPYLVFDGDYLPSKAGTETCREERREENRQKGLNLLKTNKSAAMDILQKAVDVTPLMAKAVIQACKATGVEYVVAPYEADAQLYYLEKTGMINGVISEDSDLLVFGVRLLVTKMDRFGACIEVNRDDFTRNKDISLAGWTDVEFRMMAILSGCDYLPNIKGIGLKKAHSYVRAHKTVDRIIRAIRLDGKMSVPTDYLEKFKQAELTFLHQRVWCPKAEMIVMCTEPEEPLTGEALVFIGGEVELNIARGIAYGDLDPVTKLPFNIINSPTHTPKPLPIQPPLSKRFPLRPSLKASRESIASFFTSATSSAPPPRTPLGVKSVNVIRKAFTAPHPPSSCLTPMMKKRALDEGPKTDLSFKKSRVFFEPDENVRVTGERSAFFNTPKHIQSRRPLGDVGCGRAVTSAAAIETPISKKHVHTTPQTLGAGESGSKKELSDLEKAIQESLKPEYIPDSAPVQEEEKEKTGFQKVARSLKVDFAFKNTPGGKLASLVEKHRVGASKTRAHTAVGVGRSGFMQQFRRPAGGVVQPVFKQPAKMQIPHTVGAGGESQDSVEGRCDLRKFEESQGSENEGQEFGKGFEAFMLRK